MRRVLLGASALVAAAMSAGVGMGAEVVPSQPSGSVFPKGRRPKVHRQRLERATGPGSLNEASEMQALVDAGKGAEAAAYYERCHQINYRAGKPKMRWGDVWYARYKAGDVRARGVES